MSKKRPEPAPSPEPRTAGEIPESAAVRAAWTLWWVLALLVAARAAFAFVPAMGWWSLNLHRFLPSFAAWGLWALAALSLVPPIARAVEPLLARAGEQIVRAPGRASLAFGLGAAALVWLLPDRIWFVGDFLLRQMTLEGKQGFVPQWYPQALPLDLFLHDTLGRGLIRSLHLDANGAGVLLGMVEAAVLALLALQFPRALRLTGVAAAAAAGVVFWGGYLTMFTGYNKAFAEMPLLAAAVGVFGIQAVREGRGLWPLGIAVALAFVLHRSAFGLLLAALAAWLLWFIAHGRRADRLPIRLLPIVLPLALIALMTPRILSIVTRIDPMHFAPEVVGQRGGVLAGALAGSRPLDLLNLVLMLSPLAVATPLMGWMLGRDLLRRREAIVLLALAVPLVGVMPFIHPGQGLFRDWDDFAACGMSLSLLTAWVVGLTLAAAPTWRWLGVAATLGAAVPTAQWLIHQRDLELGFRRVEAFQSEPPRRTDHERARTWDFLGHRKLDLGRWGESADAFARVAEVSPSPRVLRQWATAEVMRGDLRTAQRVLRRLTERDPRNAAAWFELSRVSFQLGDLAESRRAAHEQLRVFPESPSARRLVKYLDSLATSHE